MNPRLSKSRYMAGSQCPLRLWYDVHERDLAPPVDEATQARFDAGHEVGELAQGYCPGGVLIEADHLHPKEALEETAAVWNDEGVPAIYEAAFEYEGFFFRADIMARASRGRWDLIEVKSATQPKDVYFNDLAFQYWVLRKLGIPVRRAGLLLLNPDYVYQGGEHDLQKLFFFKEFTPHFVPMLDDIEKRARELQEIAGSDQPPEVTPGAQCFEPYDCPYYAHCTRDMEFPDHPVESLYRLHAKKKQQLLDKGIREVHEVPDSFPLSEIQIRQRECVMSGNTWASSELPQILRDIDYPAHYLDFETILPAVPWYVGTRPFGQVPFQFSCHHREDEGGEILHSEFLAVDRADPRGPLAEALVSALGQHGTIFTYSGFERRVINVLAESVPSLRNELNALQERLVDLLEIIRGHYYHPDFKGSFSIKRVLPVLVPQMTYEGMEVADGMAAGAAWVRMTTCEDYDERARIEQALREYCRQDTLAMVRLREVLERN